MRQITREIPIDEYIDDPRAAVTGTIFGMLRDLGPLETGGLRVTVSTRPATLEQLETVVMGFDFAGGTELSTIRCGCGYEPKDVADLVAHFQAHGATRLEVRPENHNPRRRR